MIFNFMVRNNTENCGVCQYLIKHVIIMSGVNAMNGGVEVMTDKQWEGMLLMVRAIVAKCENLPEAIAQIDALLEGKQAVKNEKDNTKK